jgi:hypothetical protein
MDDFYLPFAHLLVFRCKCCNRPLPRPVMSAARNLEEIDAFTFNLHCECGWKKQSLGVEAISHWVADWHAHNMSENPKHFQEGAGGESMN